MLSSGVRILDFTRLGFGAQATLICGCLGAEVIRVESTTRPDPIRVMPPFVPEPGERTTGFGQRDPLRHLRRPERQPRSRLLQVQHRWEEEHHGRRLQAGRASPCSRISSRSRTS